MLSINLSIFSRFANLIGLCGLYLNIQYSKGYTSPCRRYIYSVLSMVSPREDLLFGGIKFSHPISTSLIKQGILSPSPIQQNAIAPLATGLSCILHSQTGSGKTMAYMLPLLKRLVVNSDDFESKNKLSALIIVPTDELALQVAADGSALLNPELIGTSRIDDSIFLCLKSRNIPFDDITSQPIIISTPAVLADVMAISSTDSIAQVKYLVLDEVDRLLETLGKYATFEDREKTRHNPNAANRFLTELVKAQLARQSLAQLQIVAASATVGRPLRRELCRIFNGDSTYGDFPAIRASDSVQKSSPVTTGTSSLAASKSIGRQVVIPSTISHLILMLSDAPESRNSITGSSAAGKSMKLSAKMVAVRNLWTKDFKDVQRGILFVPSEEDVKQTIGMLRFWGWNEVKSIQQKADQSSKDKSIRELYVLSIDGARGIHIPDVESVIILSPARTMDEYLHMAGRTGRIGNKNKGGKVVSVIEFDDFKRIQSWQAPLNIEFKVRYQ